VIESSRVVCIIPAYDAAERIGGVVAGVRAALPCATIVGVDDGSRDGTRDVIDSACDRTVAFDINRGKGAALRAGFETALALGATAIVSIDADGQHDPMHAPALIDALASADVVIGTRARGVATMPWPRRMTNALSAAATRRLTGCDIPDPQSGYRALRRDVVSRIRATGDGYEFETDFLLRALRAGFRVRSIPIPTIYGPPSHFRDIRDGYRVVATFWRHARTGTSR
jgi:glycosyltransferase involved in cell wall biosynthesis